jgi:hypothetical protein
MGCSTCSLIQWPQERIDAECRSDYAAYEKKLRDHYTQYFTKHSALRCPRHVYSAATLADALPSGWGHLERFLPPQSVHRYARSGKSSQTLALALLGAAIHQDVTLKALWRTLGIGGPHAKSAQVAFEYALAPSDLQEEPRVTTLDFLAATTRELVVVECKWSERGFGGCSCLKEGDGSPQPGNSCASRVDARRGYWRTAYRDFSLPPARTRRSFCPMSVAYQPIRNVAATRLLCAGRRGVFVLLYDDANPYFRQTGAWPGWPALLSATLETTTSDFTFKAISWQSLMSVLPIPTDVREWAVEKHRLPTGKSVSQQRC